MNKVFKIVWNAATQSWVAVSELTKAHKKQSAVKNIAKLSVLATSVIAGGAMAASAVDGLIQINSTGSASTSTGVNSILIGNAASTSGNTNPSGRDSGENAVAIGNTASANWNAVAMGTNAAAKGSQAVAIGFNTIANKDGLNNEASTAIGGSASAEGDGATAVGSATVASGSRSTSIGRGATSTHDSATAIGYLAEAINDGTLAIGGAAYRGTTVFKTIASGEYATAIGFASVARGNNSVAFGYQAESQGLAAFAAGGAAKAQSTGALALGLRAEVESKAESGTAIGRQAKVTGNATNGTAIGRFAETSGKDAISLGTETKAKDENTIAIGTKNTVETSGSTAVGNNNTVSAKNVVVLGNNVTVSGARENAVVLGHASDGAATVKAVNSATVGNITYSDFAGNLGGTSTDGTVADAASDKQGRFVSVGSANNERQIKHVAAGEISSSSTDAINGSQLYQVAKNWKINIAGSTGSGTSVNGGNTVRFVSADPSKLVITEAASTDGSGSTVTFTPNFTATLPVDSKVSEITGDSNITITPDANDSTKLAITLNPNVTATTFKAGDTTVQNGKVTGLTSHIDAPTTTVNKTRADLNDQLKEAATVEDVLNAGWNLQANGEAVDAVTHGNTVDFRAEEGTGLTITKDSDGNKSTITVGNKYSKVNSTKDVSSATGTDAVAVGPNAKAEAASSVALGDDSHVTSGAAAGSVAIGKGATAGAAHTGDYKGDGATDVAGKTGAGTRVVSVGKEGDEAQIQNVAPGVISATSTDAVNGSQLYAIMKSIPNDANISNVNNRINGLDNKVNRMNKDLRAGIAGANAAAGLPQVYQPGKSMVAAAAGTFKGQHAVAVGYSRATDNGKVIFKMQGNANSRGDVGGSVGVGYQW